MRKHLPCRRAEPRHRSAPVQKTDMRFRNTQLGAGSRLKPARLRPSRVRLAQVRLARRKTHDSSPPDPPLPNPHERTVRSTFPDTRPRSDKGDPWFHSTGRERQKRSLSCTNGPFVRLPRSGKPEDSPVNWLTLSSSTRSARCRWTERIRHTASTEAAETDHTAQATQPRQT
jgi:hypothetical protein